MEIIDIIPIGKKKERFYVVLSSGERIVLHGLTLIKSKLKVGDEAGREDLEEFQFEYEKITAFDKSIDMLSRGMKTKKQIDDYLIKKGYLPKVREYVLEKLCEYRYIDDGNYADLYVKMTSKNKGKRAISYELRQKGVDEGLIQESLGQIESEYDACLAVATKYLKNRKIDEKTKEKLYRHLLGRGFEYEVIGSVARKTLQNADIEE